MTITSPARLIIFCEGTPSSLDFAVLQHIRTPKAGLIVPIGGKGGLQRFIDGYQRVHDNPQRYIVFRDRDFDLRPPDDSALLTLPDGPKHIFLSYRTCIENYLLDAALLDQYFIYCQKNALKWKFGPSPGLTQLNQWIKEAAQAITAYQATRWALATLKPKDGWIGFGFGSTWAKHSDELPDSVEEADCLSQVSSLLAAFHEKYRSITHETFQTNYSNYLLEFQQDDFWKKQKYRIFFSGKDMAKMMYKNHSDQMPPLDGFFKWGIEYTDWTTHPDFVTLATKLSD